MQNNLDAILSHIKKLEQELLQELQKRQETFLYTIDKKKVRFKKEIKIRHRLLMRRLRRYLVEAEPLNILTAPIIWSVALPAVLLDLFVTLFQAICFPIYKIPKVRRDRYIIIDRHALGYLNIIEKINCVYCGYFNGLIAYIQEVAARTEQYWCPIKHARRMQAMHSRYKNFFDYGDAESYRDDLDRVRRSFNDLSEQEAETTPGSWKSYS